MSQRAVLRPLMRCQMWAHHLLSASNGKRSTVTKGTSVPSNDIQNGLLFIKNRFLRQDEVTAGEEVEGQDDKPAPSRPCTASNYLLKWQTSVAIICHFSQGTLSLKTLNNVKIYSFISQNSFSSSKFFCPPPPYFSVLTSFCVAQANL